VSGVSPAGGIIERNVLDGNGILLIVIEQSE